MTSNISRYQPRVKIPDKARLGFWESLALEALLGFDEIHSDENVPKAYFRSLGQIDYTDVQEVFSVEELLAGMGREIRDTLQTLGEDQAKLDYLSGIWSKAREVSLKTKFVAEYKQHLEDEKDPMIGADPDKVVKLEAQVRLFEGLQDIVALEERRITDPRKEDGNGIETTAADDVKRLSAFFTEEGSKLIPFIVKEYPDTTIEKLVPLLFALRDLIVYKFDLPKQPEFKRVDFLEALKQVLGFDGSESAFNRSIAAHVEALRQYDKFKEKHGRSPEPREVNPRHYKYIKSIDDAVRAKLAWDIKAKQSSQLEQ